VDNQEMTKVSNLWEIIDKLIQTAEGLIKADIVIRKGSLVNVNSGEIIESVDVAIEDEWIALIGDASHCIGEKTKVIDARGMYITPGFIDAHVHIESSMLTVSEFASAVIPHGTTTVFADPHEIANVLGVDGVKLIIDEAKYTPLKVYITVPSCVPSSPTLETPGAIIGPKEVTQLLNLDSVIALGEMMDFPGVLQLRKDVLDKIRAALKMGKQVEGHDAGLTGKDLIAYAASGISSSHELTTKSDAINRLRLGMYAYLREGSAWLDVAETIKAITEEKLDHRHVCLVTDDREANSIYIEGHMDHVVRRAIEEGVDPIRAIQMATLNPAEHYGVDRYIGSVAPARKADILLLENLTKVKVNTVLIDGKIVVEDKRMSINIPRYNYPRWATETVKVGRKITKEDFAIKVSQDTDTIEVNVIEAFPGSVLTKREIYELPVENGEIKPEPLKSIYKLAVIERHHATGNIGLGFVKGFGFKIDALATTVAHDSHNLLVIGTNDEDMTLAVNKLIELGGGIITIKNHETISIIDLPIAGLMSNKPYEEVSSRLEHMYRLWKKLGCDWPSPFMTISLLALPVLPEIRLTDKGLVDVVEQKIISLFPA